MDNNVTLYSTIIGGLINDPKLYEQYPGLEPSDFEFASWKRAFEVVRELIVKDKREVITPELFLSKYKGRGEENPLGQDGIFSFFTSTGARGEKSFEVAFKELKKQSLLKVLQAKGYDVSAFKSSDMFNPEKIAEAEKRFETSTSEEILQYFFSPLEEIKEKYAAYDIREDGNVATGVRELIEELKKTPEQGPSLEGDYFSAACRGARRGKFYLRSGSSGSGKTRTLTFDACHLAFPEKYSIKDQGFYIDREYDRETDTWHDRKPCRTLYITTEMDKSEIQTIILAYLSGVNERNILMGTYNALEREEERVLTAASIMEKHSDTFFLERISDPNLVNVEALIKKYVISKQVEAVFFDYIFTSPALLEQFSSARVREDSVLGLMANQLKQIAQDYNVFVMSSTQVNSEGMNTDGFKDEKCLRGAKALADKADVGCVISRVGEKDREKITPLVMEYIRQHGLSTSSPTANVSPNYVIDIYKNRRGECRGVRIWVHMDLGNGERTDMFVTREDGEKYDMTPFLPQIATTRRERLPDGQVS